MYNPHRWIFENWNKPQDEITGKATLTFKIYKRALTAIEVENLYNSDTQARPRIHLPGGVVQLGTPSYDGGNDIVVNENGDVYVAGWSHGSCRWYRRIAQDLAVLKYDSSDRLWADNWRIQFPHHMASLLMPDAMSI